MKNANDVINAMVKTIGGLSGLIFLLFVISQFLAYFYFTNMATVIAVKMADALRNANLDALWLLIDFVFVVAVLDIIITDAIPKGAIFAPLLVPLLTQLHMTPHTD